MPFYHCTCFQEHVEMVLHSLRPFCKDTGWAGSMWKYLKALARANGVSERFAYSFLPELHFLSLTFCDSPTCICSSCPLRSLLAGLVSKPAAWSMSWSGVLNLSLLLEIEGLTFILGVCRRTAHAMSYRTVFSVFRFQASVLQFALNCLAYTQTNLFGSCWYSCMALVAG
jgi:hypothetical protein